MRLPSYNALASWQKSSNLTLLLTTNNFSSVAKSDDKQSIKKAPPTHKKRIFSGIQPTGVPHIGNYFGAIKPWVEFQQRITENNKNSRTETQNPMIISIVDLHAITVPKDPKVLSEYIFQCAASLLASGIDPIETILYKQSQVPYHGQLSWILGTRVTINQLSNMHQAKSKAEGLPEMPLGIFSYPVLQTADILLFKGSHIPVGEDQVQHLELARGIASKFNNFYKTDFFPLPVAIESDFTRLKSLRDPTKKMSKSDLDQNSRVDITDPSDIIAKKLRKAVTDSTSTISYDPETRPGVSTLVEIEAASTGQEIEEIIEACYLSGIETGDYKKQVAQALSDHLRPIQAEYAKLIQDRAHLSQVLKLGADRANEIAAANYVEVLKIIGAL